MPNKVKYLSLKPRALKARAAFRLSGLFFTNHIISTIHVFRKTGYDITVTKFSNLIGYEDGVTGQCAPSHLSAFVFVLSLLAKI